VKDFVRENWKIAAVCAAGAFILSLVTGFIARNPAGVVFLRAFLLALVFGGLGIGLRMVIRTYLPEAVGTAPAGGPAPKDDARGSNVNIVVGEDDAVPAQGRTSGPGAAGTVRDANEVAEDLGEEVPEDEGMRQAEARALGDLAEELADELPGSSETGSNGEPAEEDGQEGHEETSVLGEEDDEPQRGGVSEGLDSLPDISTLEIAEEPASRGPARRMGRGPGGAETPEDAIRGAVSGQDPLTLARAIRTVLKKDEKG
jgi:hypothetical protein